MARMQVPCPGINVSRWGTQNADRQPLTRQLLAFARKQTIAIVRTETDMPKQHFREEILDRSVVGEKTMQIQ
jgi:hypothetical protein